MEHLIGYMTGWYNFFITNLIPVTLGNIVGAALFVAGCLLGMYTSEAHCAHQIHPGKKPARFESSLQWKGKIFAPFQPTFDLSCSISHLFLDAQQRVVFCRSSQMQTLQFEIKKSLQNSCSHLMACIAKEAGKCHAQDIAIEPATLGASLFLIFTLPRPMMSKN